MGRVNNRSEADTDWLKARAREYHEVKGMSNAHIRSILSETDAAGDGDISQRNMRDWLAESMTEGQTREFMHNLSFTDVIYLRGRAYKATADCEINRSFIMERAYWWGLYISSMHLVLRSALGDVGTNKLPPQFIVENLNQWYADLRSIRQLKPKLQMDADEIEETLSDLDAFEKHYGRDLKLPKETL